MHKIFDIRGTHGSGKSTIPLLLLEDHDSEPVKGLPLTYEGRVGVLGYHLPTINLYIVGKYETACGGCDGIKTQEEIKARVDMFSKLGNVLLEGILVAHTFGPWLEFSEGKDWHFCILNTPLSECIDRVNARRAKSGKGPLEDPRNIVRDHARITGLYDKFLSAGRSVTWLDGSQPYNSFVEYYINEV